MHASLAGAADSQLKRLQSVYNSAAWLVSGARRCDHIVTNSTQSPLASNTSVSHLQDRSARVEVWTWYCSCRNFYVPTGCIQLPRVRTSKGQRSFAFHGPSIWNSLPSTMRDSSLSLRAFKERLKTSLRSWTITNLQTLSGASGMFWFCNHGAVYKCSDLYCLLTYLLMYLLCTNNNSTFTHTTYAMKAFNLDYKNDLRVSIGHHYDKAQHNIRTQ